MMGGKGPPISEKRGCVSALVLQGHDRDGAFDAPGKAAKT